MHQSHHVAGCYATCINSLLISFIHILCCLCLLHQAIALTRITKIIIVKTNIIQIYIIKSHIITKKCDIRTCINKDLSLKNTALPKSLSILFVMRIFILSVANQLGTNVNNGRQVLTDSLHISWELSLLGQCFKIKGSLETVFSHISGVL